MMTGFVVTLQDMRSTEVKDVRMYAVSRQAAADGARGRRMSRPRSLWFVWLVCECRGFGPCLAQGASDGCAVGEE